MKCKYNCKKYIFTYKKHPALKINQFLNQITKAMKKPYTYFMCACAVQILTAGICSAQTIELKAPPAGITIDGSAKEWGDNLSYTDAKTKINYTIANDKDNLYLIVKTKDPVQQSNILGSGIAFSVDVKGRKKTSYIVSFPAKGPEDPAMYMNLTPTQSLAKIQLMKFRKIHTEGFKGLSDPDLPVSNTDGIKVAMDYDAAGYLVYEEAIPLSLFHANTEQMTKEWSYNIQLNALERTEKSGAKANNKFDGAGSARGNVSSDKRESSFGSGNINKIDPEGAERITTVVPGLDFWGKFTLAKAQ